MALSTWPRGRDDDPRRQGATVATGCLVCSHLNDMKLRRFIQLLCHVFLFILKPNSISCPETLYSHSYRQRMLEDLSSHAFQFYIGIELRMVS